MPRGRRHYRITLNDALLAHEIALESGGRPGILDIGRVEAAINRPYSGYHRPIAAKAAALFEAVANNHGFVDANKRTAVLLTDLLLMRSGYLLVKATTRENLNFALTSFAVSVARGDLSSKEITEWFVDRIRARDDDVEAQ